MRFSIYTSVLSFALLSLVSNSRCANDPSQPNVVFILSDDQDAQMNSIEYMENVKNLLIKEGTQFTKHYAHVSLCCPSRVSLWTGRHAHNTNVTDVGGPGGGWKQIQAVGLYNKYLPVWLQDSGYNTYYSGKLYNGHSVTDYCAQNKCAVGWTESVSCRTCEITD